MSSVAPGLVGSQMVCHEIDLEANKRSVRVLFEGKVYEDIAKNISFDPSLFFIPIPEPTFVIKNQEYDLISSRTPTAVRCGVKFTDQFVATLWYFNLETLWVLFCGKHPPGVRLESIFDLNRFYVGYSVYAKMKCNQSLDKYYIRDLKDQGKQFECRLIGPWRSPLRPKPEQTAKRQTKPPARAGQESKPEKAFKEKKRDAIKDIQKHYPSLGPNTLELKVYRAYYRWTRSVDITKRPHFPWTKSHAGWYCSAGIKRIATTAHCSVRSVKTCLKKWCKDHMIECRYPGEKGKSMSVYELPKNWRHVLRVRRKKKMWGLIKRKALPG